MSDTVYVLAERIEKGERVTVADLSGLTEEELKELQRCLPDARIVFDPEKSGDE